MPTTRMRSSSRIPLQRRLPEDLQKDSTTISFLPQIREISFPRTITTLFFAVAGEELGFFGCCGIILLRFCICPYQYHFPEKAKDLSGTLICCGTAQELIAFQSFLISSVATGILPNTGTPLPLRQLWTDFPCNTLHRNGLVIYPIMPPNSRATSGLSEFQTIDSDL